MSICPILSAGGLRGDHNGRRVVGPKLGPELGPKQLSHRSKSPSQEICQLVGFSILVFFFDRSWASLGQRNRCYLGRHLLVNGAMLEAFWGEILASFYG